MSSEAEISSRTTSESNEKERSGQRHGTSQPQFDKNVPPSFQKQAQEQVMSQQQPLSSQSEAPPASPQFSNPPQSPQQVSSRVYVDSSMPICELY